MHGLQAQRESSALPRSLPAKLQILIGVPLSRRPGPPQPVLVGPGRSCLVINAHACHAQVRTVPTGPSAFPTLSPSGHSNRCFPLIVLSYMFWLSGLQPWRKLLNESFPPR